VNRPRGRPRGRKKWPTFATSAEEIAYDRGREDMRAEVVKLLKYIAAITPDAVTLNSMASFIKSQGKPPRSKTIA
jgi:hypothetical protein